MSPCKSHSCQGYFWCCEGHSPTDNLDTPLLSQVVVTLLRVPPQGRNRNHRLRLQKTTPRPHSRRSSLILGVSVLRSSASDDEVLFDECSPGCSEHLSHRN